MTDGQLKFRLFYFHPTDPFVVSARCGDIAQTDIEDLIDAFDWIRAIAPNELILLKPEGLSLRPANTRFSRAQEWLRNNLSLIEDPESHIDRVERVKHDFPNGPSGTDVDIFIVTRDVAEASDTVGELRFSPRRVLKECETRAAERLKRAPSPSNSIKDISGIRKIITGNDAIVHGGRPAHNYGPPPALFHPALGILDYHLRHLDQNLAELQPHSNLIKKVHLLMKRCLDTYDTDDARTRDLNQTLVEDIFSSHVRVGTGLDRDGEAGKFQVEGAVPDGMWGWPYVYIFKEGKNEFGLNGDPFLQALISYAKCIATPHYEGRSLHTNHPAIILAFMGDFIEIGSAISIGGSVYPSRLFSQRVCLDFFAHDTVLRLAQAFKAVDIAANSIREFYERLVPQQNSLSVAHLFPSPIPLDDVDEPLPALTFKCRLHRSGYRYVFPEDVPHNVPPPSDMISSGTYVAHMLPQADSEPPSPPSEVVVKFTARYNAHAHKVLADEGLAPTLRECRKVHGGLYMVVMDYIPGDLLWYLHSEPHKQMNIPSTVYEDVERAIKSLHEENLVFGDLRTANVICVPGPQTTKAMLLDFDWVGKDGEDRYPTTLNSDLRSEWAPGVERYGVMRKEHDLDMLGRLRGD